MKSVLVSLFITAFTFNAQAANLFDIQEAGGTLAFANLNVTSVDENLNQINPRFQSVTGAQVKFSSKEIQLTVKKAMPRCAPGMMCIQVMPAPLHIKLPIVAVEQTPCSVLYVARASSNVGTNINEEIIIEDFSQSTCASIANSVGTVAYTVEGLSSASKTVETATAVFTVQNEFIHQ